MHGYGIASWIEAATDDVLRVEEGSLYPALYRMTRKGWIGGKWGTTQNNRRAKYYHLTSEGRRPFVDQTSGWQRLAAAARQAGASTRAPSWARQRRKRCGYNYRGPAGAPAGVRPQPGVPA